MGCPVCTGPALLFTSVLALLCGVSSVLGQDLRERDALCNADGCFVVHFQRKTFLESWRSCKERGGNLATIKRKEDASAIAVLFSALDLRHSRTKIQVWIGLQRQPRRCSATRPLRGFSWTTGDQDTEYTNWQNEDSPNSCLVSRCGLMGYSLLEKEDNLKWQDGPCSVPTDGYLCHYGFKGMCPALWAEGGGNTLYTTPFDLLSTVLTHIPLGSVAIVPCPVGTKEEQTVLCVQADDGSVRWSRDSPLCSDPLPDKWCDLDNGGCEHYCRPTAEHYFCECADGYQLGDDQHSCELSFVCQGAPCEYECLPLSDGYRCACPEGYMLGPDERSCLDVDECLQSPCEQICENAPGSFECRCWHGYEPDEEGGCEDVDECMNEPCEHACENTQGSHICHCHLGFSPVPEDPKRCQDDDECQIAGICEQMCVNDEGGFQCYCGEGYELMPDNKSCRKKGEGDDLSSITSPFPWVTHQPGSEWDLMDYDWTPHTNWPPEDEQPLNWLTDPPRVSKSDVIWVTSAPQDDLPLYSAVDSLTPGDENDEGVTQFNGDDWFEWGLKTQPDLEVIPNAISTTAPPQTSTEPDSYEDDKEATTALPFLSSSTVSEGAWNWWSRLATPSPKPGNPEDLVTNHDMTTDSSYHNEGETFPEELGEQKNEDPTALTELTSAQPTTSAAGQSRGTVDPGWENTRQKHDSTWLLVGLLVPICVLILVMLALVVVYCTHSSLQSRSKNVTDCYHWISGAHDPQGAPNPPAGVKTCP